MTQEEIVKSKIELLKSCINVTPAEMGLIESCLNMVYLFGALSGIGEAKGIVKEVTNG